MSEFYIINESNEDTLDVSNDLEDAVRIAKELTKGIKADDAILIIEPPMGKCLRRFVLRNDGTVDEESVT